MRRFHSVRHLQRVYTGRISRAPFARWANTEEGRAAIDEVAGTIRFAPFGRQRAARRRLWRALTAAASDDTVIETVRAEAQRYLKYLGDLAYADGLPRDTVMRGGSSPFRRSSSRATSTAHWTRGWRRITRSRASKAAGRCGSSSS